MRCKRCQQAFNGSLDNCPFCGTNHIDITLTKVMEKVEQKAEDEIKPTKKVKSRKVKKKDK